MKKIKQNKHLNLRTRIILAAIEIVADRWSSGCCEALRVSWFESYKDSKANYIALSQAKVMLYEYFRPTPSDMGTYDYSFFWPPIKAGYDVNRKGEHQQVTPRIIALQILALLSEELP